MNARISAVFFLILGCTDVQALPTHMAALPPVLGFTPSILEPGGSFDVQLTDMPPGARVWIMASESTGAGPCLANPSVCLDLASPTYRVATGVAAADGTWSRTITVPPHIRGTFYLQGGSLAGGVGSLSEVASMWIAGFDDLSPSQLWLDDLLDEPEGYCLDITGFAAGIQLNAPLNAHTCKLTPDDQTFVFGMPSAQQIYNPAYDRCLAAPVEQVGEPIYVADCDSTDGQRWQRNDAGQLELRDTNLCIVVDDGAGQPTGGPSHLFIGMGLQDCDLAAPSRSQWTITPL